MPTLINVTGGSLFIYSPSGSAFSLLTPAFHARLNLADIGSFTLPNFLAPGSTVSLHGSLAGSSLGSGPVDFNGQVYPQLWFGGALTFKAKSFVVPTSTPAQPVARVVAFKLT